MGIPLAWKFNVSNSKWDFSADISRHQLYTCKIINGITVHRIQHLIGHVHYSYEIWWTNSQLCIHLTLSYYLSWKKLTQRGQNELWPIGLCSLIFGGWPMKQNNVDCMALCYVCYVYTYVASMCSTFRSEHSEHS